MLFWHPSSASFECNAAGWVLRKESIKHSEVNSVKVTLCNPMDHTAHGTFQARILEWVAFPFSRGSSQPRVRTQVSHIAGRFFTSWATREAQNLVSAWSGSRGSWEEHCSWTGSQEQPPGRSSLNCGWVDATATQEEGSETRKVRESSRQWG